MTFGSIDDFLRNGTGLLAGGPVALVLAEDGAELASTIDHCHRLGFERTLLFHAPQIAGTGLPDGVAATVPFEFGAPDAAPVLLTRIMARARPGTWIYWGYNAEYLLFPHCETRSVAELLAFHSEERREAMLAYVIDLYAADLGRDPTGVNRTDAWFDSRGYYATDRHGPDGATRERQVDVFGGIRRRFEEHVPWERRRIDRVALFRAQPGLAMRPDFTLSNEEMNTYACPWHHSLTAAVASFRTAKALRQNPGSRDAIRGFVWDGSRRFDWSSRQLLELGMIEPGQWF